MEMIKKWFTDFRCDRTSGDNTERSGRPKDVRNPKIVEKPMMLYYVEQTQSEFD